MSKRKGGKKGVYKGKKTRSKRVHRYGSSRGGIRL